MHEQMWPLWLTLALALVYFVKQWCWPSAATRQHDRLRSDWLQSVSATPGTEVLGVQTIRNSLMSCTMTATAATLAFMGSISLLYSSWAQTVSLGNEGAFCSMCWPYWCCWGMALHHLHAVCAQWHHAGFVAGMPVGSAQRQRWLPLGRRCLRKAGRYYALSVRLLMWCVPVAVVGLFAMARVIAAVLMLVVLWRGIDR